MTLRPVSAPTPEAGVENDEAITVHVRGARGSIPSPGRHTAHFGGNTSCVEVRVGGKRLIFDAGTGIRQLGAEMMSEGGPVEAQVFLTHFHWDHIQGFPFFAPLYDPKATLHIRGPEQLNIDLQTLFAGQMGPIYFPIPFEAVAATMHFTPMDDDGWSAPGIRVRPLRVRHPAFTVGYRIEAAAGSICYIPDNELRGGEYPVGEGWRSELVSFIEGADLLIHDAMFTDEEYERRIGWGHSTFAEALDLAEEAGVRKLLLFHHDPERSDDELAKIVEHTREDVYRRSVALEVAAASEGSELVIEEDRV